MTYIVSISDFRNNISDYLEKVKNGDSLEIKDEKKNETIATVVAKKKFNARSFLQAVHDAAGTVSIKNHPEWATRAKLEKWLRGTRLKDERHFDVHP